MIDSHTMLLGLLGWPVTHSFSPAMHNAALRALGLNGVYLALATPPAQLPNAVRGLPALGFRGVNVTIPHKQAVMPLLDVIESAAQAIGAVNTIVNEEGALRGLNTDWSGFSADLAAHDIVVQGRDCIVLGAGGSARAVVYALGRAGASVHVFARRLEQARQLSAELTPWLDAAPRPHDLATLPQHPFPAPLIVNTTPVGMHPDVDRSPWPDRLPFPDGAAVYDLVYNPRDTLLLRRARAAGCRAVNGLGMLLRQGAQAFTIWTGQEPDLAVMERAVRSA